MVLVSPAVRAVRMRLLGLQRALVVCWGGPCRIKV